MDPLTVSTIVLALFTALMAWQTRNLARASSDLVKIERRPQIAFMKPTFRHSFISMQTAVVQVGFVLKNTGKVIARYEFDPETLEVECQGAALPPPEYFSYNGYIFPGQTMVFSYNVSENNSFAVLPLKGTIKYHVRYNSVPPIVEHSTSREIEFHYYYDSDKLGYSLAWKAVNQHEE